MNHFSIMNGEQVIIHSKGVYYQVDLYTRQDNASKKLHVYLKKGGGFIRLLKNGTTGKPDIKWVEVSHSKTPVFDDIGYMVR